jgi:hypothetical protein
MSDLIERLRKGVPCGRTLGHGESCSKGYLCEGCSLRNEAANELVFLRGQLEVALYAPDIR